MSNQATNNNLNYLIDPTFTKVNRPLKMKNFFFQNIVNQKLNENLQCIY